jgi:hypothetical protein
MATIILEIPDELMSQIIQLGDRFPEWLMVNLPDAHLYPHVTSLSDDEVRDRFGNRGEYCLSHQDYIMGRLQID